MRENCGSICDQIDRKCENYLRINLIFGEEKVKLAKLDEKPSSNMRRRNTLRNLSIISRHRNPDSCVWILWTETQSEWERKWKRTKRERLWELICKWMLQQPYLWLSDSQCGLAPVLITLHPLHLTQPPRWCHNSRRFTAPSMPLQIEANRDNYLQSAFRFLLHCNAKLSQQLRKVVSVVCMEPIRKL